MKSLIRFGKNFTGASQVNLGTAVCHITKVSDLLSMSREKQTSVAMMKAKGTKPSVVSTDVTISALRGVTVDEYEMCSVHML